MNTTIQLLPGLEISFSDDGTWLHFDGGQQASSVNLESLGNRLGIIGAGISGWCERARSLPFVNRAKPEVLE